jgi:transcriptional regulator with XRE-family HTH domain
MPTPHRPSAGVRQSLRKLGFDIRDARRRRGLPAAVIAERAFTSRPTLQRVEAGDPGVSMGIYAAVLQALGLMDGLAALADASRDTVGLALATLRLPARMQLPRRVRADAS